MKALRLIFGSLYVILILLLLLLSLKHCQGEPISDDPIDVGRMGKLKVTLVWDREGDLDLHAIEPGGAHIYFDDKHPAGAYGELDVDNRPGGVGSAENIYWEEPPTGSYTVYVKYYKDRVPGDIPCKVYVYKKGVLTDEFSITLNTKGQEIKIPDIIVED